MDKMNGSIKYTCECYGDIHENWPALTFISPDNYDFLSADDKKNIAELKSDTCIINHPNQTDRFIRCTLTQLVNDHCEGLEYGLWVSLSEKSFQDYMENFDNDNHEVQYFGWLCNNIPEYKFSESIPTTVITKKGNQRPEIFPHESFDHPFVIDYYNGISKKEAETRIKMMLQKTKDNKLALTSKKIWWKFW